MTIDIYKSNQNDFDYTGNVFGKTQGDQQALIILTGKSVLTEAELEQARDAFPDVTFTEEKKR